MKKTVDITRYRHNEEGILKACGLVRRDAALRQAYDLLIEYWNDAQRGSRRVEVLETFLGARGLSKREKAFLLFHLTSNAFDAGFEVGQQIQAGEVATSDTDRTSPRLVGNA